MAFLNKVMLIGRLTDNPEPPRVLPNSGSTVVKFRFAVGKSKKNPQTGQWENDPNPLYIDCEVFSRPDEGATFFFTLLLTTPDPLDGVPVPRTALEVIVLRPRIGTTVGARAGGARSHSSCRARAIAPEPGCSSASVVPVLN